MRDTRKTVPIQLLKRIEKSAPEHCACLPLSAWSSDLAEEQGEVDGDEMRVTPATAELNAALRTILNKFFFPRSTPLSMLHLHIFQLEHLQFTPQAVATFLHKRERYHAPASLLEQVLVNVRRALRVDDLLLTHDGTGAVMLFPEVDQQGAYSILERVDRNIELLQAETVVPPLKRETHILAAIGSYPEPGASMEQLLFSAGVTARKLTLRPAILPQYWSVLPETPLTELSTDSPEKQPDSVPTSSAHTQGVPFMRLPIELPVRLKQLIPYQTAFAFRCAPVGRDHHCLTVAMADPTNAQVIHTLRELTGMAIFPVSCELSALDALLTHHW